jgi:hypothetical protein
MKGFTTAFVVLLGLALLSPPGHAATLWDSFSVGIGGQGAWFDGGEQPSMSDVEATGRAAFSITPHISVIGGAAYGFGDSYLRSSAGFRLTATDVNDQNFSVGVGIARHFRSEPGPLDEWAAEAGIGWKPLASSEFILTSSAAYGLDTERRLFTLGLVYPVKLTLGN